MEASNRRRFSREFKVEAVRMVNEGNRSMNAVARDLGLHANVLGRWKRQLSDDPNYSFPGKGKLKEPDAENRRLRREVERLKDGARHFKKSHQYLFQRKRVRFRFIDNHRGIWPLYLMCRVLKVTAQGYYAWKNRPESPRSKANRELLTQIRVAHEASHQTYGSTRIHAELKAKGIDCSRGRIARTHARPWHQGQKQAEVSGDHRLQAQAAGGRQRA